MLKTPKFGLALILFCGACGEAEDPAIEEAKRIAAYDLRDPESAKFRKVHRCSSDKSMVWGELNAKNAFGAYTGYKFFVVANGNKYDAENDVHLEEFMAIMNRCSGTDFQVPNR